MNKILNKTLLGFFVVSASGFTTSCFGPKYPGKKFVIFHTNDTHSRVTEGSDELGFARISAIIEKERKENENRTLFFDAGDTFHGKLFANLNKGKSTAEIFNAMKLDAIAPGNHDFNYGYKHLLELTKAKNFTALAANVYDQRNQRLFAANKIFEKDGVRFGVFGLATPETLYKTHPKNVEGLKFLDPLKTAKEQVKELQGKDVDVIIGVGHIGSDETTKIKSSQIAKEVNGLHLFVDGHSHQTLNEKHGDTLLVQIGEHTNNLGRVELFFDEKTKKVNIEEKLLKFAEYKDIKPDPKIVTIINKYNKINDDLTSDVVAKTDIELSGEREIVRTRENILGNLIATSILKKTGADFALQNGGGIRETIKKGDITKKDIIEVLPFNNIVMKVEITGKKLIEAIEHGISDYPEPKGAFPNVAGMKIVFDSNNKVISALDQYGRKIEENKTYTLATNDFLLAGGDDYTMLKGLKQVGEYDQLDEILIDFMKNQNWKAYAKLEGRIGPKK